MWGGWLTLYLWFLLIAVAGWSGSPFADAVSDILDVVSGFAIWWCFLVLELPSVNVEGQRDRNKEFRRTVWLVASIGALCAFLGAMDRLFDLNHVGVLVGLYNALALSFLTGRRCIKAYFCAFTSTQWCNCFTHFCHC